MRFLGTSLFCLVALGVGGSFADDIRLPPGHVFGGVVEDDGRALFVLDAPGSDGDSVFVRLVGRKMDVVDLPGIEARGLRRLANGDFLLASLQGSEAADNRTSNLDIVKLKGGKLRSVGAWSAPVWGNHYDLPAVSGDGRIWAMSGDDGRYSLGRFDRKSRRGQGTTRASRIEVADLGKRRGTRGWDGVIGLGPDAIIVDSDGPVLFAPWNEGAYVLHFAENASSPYVLPVLFGDGVEEVAFQWQWNERVLWAQSSRHWKAYHLWDRGLSPSAFEAPFWVVEKTATWPHTAWPHTARGIVRLAKRGDGSCRVEHVWRDPWSRVEERWSSDWLQGTAPKSRSAVGLLYSDVFVSSSGRHAVVIEQREEGDKDDKDGGAPSRVRYVRRIEMNLVPTLPPVEPERDADADAGTSPSSNP